MRKIIVLLIMLTFVLSSCSIDWNDEKDKKITELRNENLLLNKKIDDDLFQKNVECNKLDAEINAYAINFYWEKVQIKNIFYSPKRQSCLFSVYSVRDFWNSNIYILDIVDILSKESIYWIDSKDLFLYKDIIDWNCYWIEEKCKLFNNKIKELKWE